MLGILLAAESETREVFEDINVFGKTIFYVLATLSIGVFLWGMWKRYTKYAMGRPVARLREIPPAEGSRPTPDSDATDQTTESMSSGVDEEAKKPTGQRWNAVGTIATNSTVAKRDPGTRIAHLLIFWGFITLFIGTVILTIDEDIVKLGTNAIGEERSFFNGIFYMGYSLVLDVMGVLALVALFYMAVRRGILRPPRLDYKRAEQPEGGYSRRKIERGDQLFIGLLLLIFLTGFLHEGLRIRASDFPSFEVWSPVGWLTAKTVSGVGITQAASDTIRTYVWWTHSLLAFAFVAYIPYSKAVHMFTDTANLAAFDPTSSRALPAPTAGAEHLGYRVMSDFTWKELLDFDACTKCGLCHEACPARASGAPLSPRDLILDLRQWTQARGGTHTIWDDEQRPDATGPLATEGSIAGTVISAETLWSCTTCMACVEVCPVGIEHVPTIVELRRALVEEGEMEPSLQSALQNIAQKGNSFGKSARQRARWTKGLDFTITDARKEPVTYLWFVGDFASFDDRLQELSRTFATTMHDAGISFGILYEGERNAGNDVRRVGEEGLFEMLVEQNMEALSGAVFDEIVTTDPHTLNTLRNEYPKFGLDKPVLHYTELLAALFDAGDITARPLSRRVTYHDPCYLGRYNHVTDAPRQLLASLGCELIEMPRNRENSFCCGAGGGRIWMDDSGLTERPSENRMREAAELNVDAFVVACPKDYTMYTDAAKTTGHDQTIEVVDIIQLVAQAMSTELADVEA